MAAALAIRVSHFMGQKDYAAVRRNAYDGFRLNLLFLSLIHIYSIPLGAGKAPC